MLVGAYGTDAGLAATALLLMAYAAAAGLQIAAGSAWRWVGGARRRASDVGSLLDDGKMKTFQRATLQIFDMPHHPRRLRQAVRRWREWRRLTSRDAHSREDGEKTSRADAAGDGARAPRDRRGVSGPGARDTPERLGSGYLGAYGAAHSARDDPGYLGFTHEGERFTDDRAFADPPDARPSDGFAAARAALASCDVCRSLAPEAIAKLATEHMREVHIAAGEDVFRGRVRDDELAVLVSGAVAVGEFAGASDASSRRGLADEAEAFSLFEGGGATVVRDRGVALNSLLDVLEGSEHAHVAVRAAGVAGAGMEKSGDPESPGRAGAPSAAGGADPSLNPFGDDQLVSAAAEAAAAASKAAAEAANELANEAVLDSFRPGRETRPTSASAAETARTPAETARTPPREQREQSTNASANASPVRASPALFVTTPSRRSGVVTNAMSGPSSPRPLSPLGVAAIAAAAAAARDEDENLEGDASGSPSPSAGGASDLADASASAGSDERSFPATPTRAAPERAAEGEARASSALEHLVSARDSVSRPGTPGRVGRAASRSGGGSGLGGAGFAPHSSAFAAADFSGGPGGLPRLRARGAEGGCVVAAVPLRAFHRAAGFQLGIQAPAMRLCGGYHALCHYLRAPGELGALWVDPPPRDVPRRRAGATLALARLLGAEAARAVDRGALEALLERRGYETRGGRDRTGGQSRRYDGDGDGDGSDGSDASGSGVSSAGTPGGSRAWFVSESRDEATARRSRAGSGYGVSQRTGSAGVAASRGGSASAANSARGGAPVELEAMALVPFEAVRFRTAAAAALLVERGSLEGYVPTPPEAAGANGRTGANGDAVFFRGDAEDAETRRDRVFRDRANRTREGSDRGTRAGRPGDPIAFTAHAGSCVGEFLLLTGQRAAVTLRAGADGAVVAALPHSAVARLVRTYPSTYARIATRIARRLRPSLPARAWDRCGARWIPLGAGQTLADRLASSRAAARRRDDAASVAERRLGSEADAHVDRARMAQSHASHPDGVYVVVTGCVRLAAENERAFGGFAGDFDDAFAEGAADGPAGVGGGARFLGPGDAVGEGAILRDAAGAGFGAGFGEAGARREGADEMARGAARGSPPSGGRAPGLAAGSSWSRSLRRARAVRESQLLWIPAASLESLATSAPRAFAALAWRMGARAGDARRGAARAALSHPVGVGVGTQDDQPGVAKSGSASTRFGVGTLSVPGSFQFSDAFSPHAPRAVAVVPVSEGAALALDEFCAATLAALRATPGTRARVADSAARLAEVGQAGVGALANEATAHWLAQLEAAHDVVLLKADPFPSPWCAQCARHADAILLVASSEDTPPTKEEGRALQARLLRWDAPDRGLAQRELVLLHASAELAPTGTRAWLEAFSVHRHHHLARAPAHGLAPAHASRLARALRRRSVGLVLAGGGARGFAHVGVLMALEEEGIPVDMLGGTSMGSFVGGVYAKEPTALLTRIIARRLAVHMSSAWEQLLDLTVPIVSYFSGFRMNRALEPLFRGAKIEDCWLPFFCLTLDLISCAPIVHRNGTLWRYVRASMALVGFLPPVCDQSRETEVSRFRVAESSRGSRRTARVPSTKKETKMHVLVDGGYVNNLPTDVMRAMGARVVIAVDVSGRGLPETRMKPWGDAISGVRLFLRNALLPSWLGGGPTCPTMAQMQSHLPFVTDYANAARRVGTVDIMVRPAVADVPILAFGRYAEIVRAGHEAGLRAVRAWKLANPEAAPMLDDGLWRPGGGRGPAGHGAQGHGQSSQGAPQALRRGPGSRDFQTRRRPASRLADSDDGGDSETDASVRLGTYEVHSREPPLARVSGDARERTDSGTRFERLPRGKSAERRRGFAEWFLGWAEDAEDAEEADADETGAAESSETWAGEFPPRDVNRRGGNAAGFFSPDQPAPSMRQRHRYNSYQSGLDGDSFHHPHS